MKDLCRAMGWKWCDHKWVRREDNTYFCSEPGCWYSERCAAFYEHELPRNPSPTDEAFCWKALQYMMGREDYNEFDKSIWYKYHNEVINWRDGDKPSDYLKWLFSDPAQFIALANEWCREHPEKGE